MSDNIRTCYSCKIAKPLDEFSNCKSRPSGKDYKCKCCRREYDKLRTQKMWSENRDHLLRKYREQQRKYTEKNKEKESERRRIYRFENYQSVRSKENERNNSAQAKSRQIVAKAIRSNKIVRPESCPKCGTNSRKIEAHHTDYSKPLDISWLCSQCHGLLHRKI